MDVFSQLGPAARRRRRHPAADWATYAGTDERRGLPADVLYALQAAGGAFAEKQVPGWGGGDARGFLHGGDAGVSVYGVS